MKTTFSRTFSTAATILLLALLLLGTSFRYLVKDYLTDTTVSNLQQDASVIAKLAASYSIEGSLTSRDFLLNLDVASQISGSIMISGLSLLALTIAPTIVLMRWLCVLPSTSQSERGISSGCRIPARRASSIS